MNLILLSVL